MPPGLASLRPRNVFYGWYIVAAAAASNFLILGILLFTFGAFVKPIQEEMGWSVAAISIGISIRGFQQGTLSPVTGYLIDWFGPRRTGITGVTIGAVGLVIFSLAQDLWVYYLASVVIAFGSSLGAFAPFTRATTAWFHRKRGRAIGFQNSGNAMAYFVLAAAAMLIDAIGWRETLRLGAAIAFFAGVPLAMVIRGSPEEYGYLPDGEDPRAAESLRSGAAPQPAGLGGGMDVRQAVRTPAFYLVTVPFGLGAAVFSAWVVHVVVHLENVGFSSGAVVIIVGVYGVLQASLRIVMGWTGDIIGRRRLFLVGSILWGAGLFLLAHTTASDLWLLPLFYVTASVGHASWSVMGTVAIADYFGPRRFSTLTGVSTLIMLPIGVLTPWLTGWLFDRNGDYVLAFELLGAMVAAGAIFLALIRRPMWGMGGSTSPDASA